MEAHAGSRRPFRRRTWVRLILVCFVTFLCSRTTNSRLKILCVISRSTSLKDAELSSIVRRLWARDVCTALEFVDENTFGAIIDWNETSQTLAKKMFRTYRFIYTKYFSDGTILYDFVFKADLDTYVVKDNFKLYLAELNPAEPIYAGKQFVHFDGTPFAAGAGYVMSSRTFLEFGKQIQINHTEGLCNENAFHAQGNAEDLATGKCLGQIGIFPHNTRDMHGKERFMVFNPTTMYDDTQNVDQNQEWYRIFSFNGEFGERCCSERAVIFHHIDLTTVHSRLVYSAQRWKWGRSHESTQEKNIQQLAYHDMAAS